MKTTILLEALMFVLFLLALVVPDIFIVSRKEIVLYWERAKTIEKEILKQWRMVYFSFHEAGFFFPLDFEHVFIKLDRAMMVFDYLL